MDPGVDCRAVLVLALVEDVVGGKQHEEAELVGLALETHVGHVVGQPAQAGARQEDLLLGPEG